MTNQAQRKSRWRFCTIVALFAASPPSGCGSSGAVDVLPKDSDVTRIQALIYPYESLCDIAPIRFTGIMDELRKGKPVEEGKWPPLGDLLLTKKDGTSLSITLYAMDGWPILWFCIRGQRACFECSEGSHPAITALIRADCPVQNDRKMRPD